MVLVLDLPQLYTRPSVPVLFDTLSKLAIKPTSWSSETETSTDSPVAIDEDGIPQYLTSIIASQLRWIEDEHVREQVWEMASSRLSERSGRTGELYLIHFLKYSSIKYVVLFRCLDSIRRKEACFFENFERKTSGMFRNTIDFTTSLCG